MNLFQRRISEIAKAGEVIDLGGGRGFQKMLAPYRGLFHGNYRTLDSDAATGPDIVGDAMALPFTDNSCRAFLSISMLEHVPEPHRAVDEMYRTLRPGGQALLYVPFLYPYHARQGAYRDYFRFSPDALRFLFKGFSHVELEPTKRFFEMWLFMLPRIGVWLAPAGRLMDRMFRTGDNQASGYYVYAVK